MNENRGSFKTCSEYLYGVQLHTHREGERERERETKHRAYMEMSSRLEVAISRCRNFDIGSFYVFCGVVFLFCYWWKSTKLENPSGLPVIGRRWYEIGYGKARERFRRDCLGLVRSCFEKVSRVPIPSFCLSPKYGYLPMAVRRCFLSLY